MKKKKKNHKNKQIKNTTTLDSNSFDPILFFKQVKLKKFSNSNDIRQG